MRLSASWLRRLCMGAAAAVGLALVPVGASAATTISCTATAIKVCTGNTTERSSGLPAKFKIEFPPNWNGTLLLYSHGYNSFDVPLPPQDAGDSTTGAWLTARGYAIAGSAYARAGWSVQQAFEDQIDLLDLFTTKFGHPSRTIAWGHSLGGIITAGLVQLHPERFQGALPMCGVVEGGPAIWNEGLDALFAFTTLQAPNLHFHHLNPATVGSDYTMALNAFGDAQKTAAGKAHIALAAALNNLPGWFNPTSPEPPANDYATREVNQLQWISGINLFFAFFGRLELEIRAGGEYSWNTGVDYKKQLAHSTGRAEVQALYAAAGLNLEDELEKLNDTPRIAANPGAVAYLSKYIVFNGDLDLPVLTMHTSGDGLVEPTAEQAYASVVRSAGDNNLLRQVFVHRAGHCTFTPAETIAAFKTLKHRLDSGRWGGTDAAAMNATAGGLGLGPAAFVQFKPTQFLRPFDARNLEERAEGHD